MGRGETPACPAVPFQGHLQGPQDPPEDSEIVVGVGERTAGPFSRVHLGEFSIFLRAVQKGTPTPVLQKPQPQGSTQDQKGVPSGNTRDGVGEEKG